MKTEPWDHQLKEFEDYKDSKARAMLWGMRTGKTKASIDKASYLYLNQNIKGILVIAPKGVHTNWVKRELPIHAWDQTNAKGFVWLSDKSKTKKFKRQAKKFLKHEGLKVLAINPNAINLPRCRTLIKQFLAVCGEIKLIVDESHEFGKHTARKTKNVVGLARKCSYREILTGTSVLNSPLQAYSQYEILEPNALGFKKPKQFTNRYAVYKIDKTRSGRQYSKLKFYKNLEELRLKLAKFSSVVRREDIDDMPELLFVERPVYMDQAQQEAYYQMSKKYVALMDTDDEVIVTDEGPMFAKLQQILSGFIINEQKEVISISDNPPRLQACLDEINEKTIIWCHYIEDIRRVSKRLKEKGLKYVQYWGGVSNKQKEYALDNFNETSDIQVFVGQPKAGGQGLDLSAASTIIYYGHPPTKDAIIREQSLERGTKKGKKSVTIVDLYTPDTSDELILAKYKDKKKRADFVSGTGLKEVLKTFINDE